MGRNRTRVSRASTGRLYRLSYHTASISTRRRRTDSNRRETGLQAAASPLGHDAAISSKGSGGGSRTQCHFLVQSQASFRLDDPGSCVHVLIHRVPQSPVPSQSSVSVSGGFLSAGSRVPNQRSIERRPSHALRHLCESSPAAPGLSRSAPERTRTSPSLLPTWEGVDFLPSQNHEGRPGQIALISVLVRMAWLVLRHPRDEDIRIGLIGNR
jgi:hypothetical protein